MARISENDWATLVTKIRERNCTPIIGAGASHPPLPLGTQLAMDLIGEEEQLLATKDRGIDTAKRYPLADRSDLAKVTQFIAVSRRDASVPKSRIARLVKGTRNLAENDDALFTHRVLADLSLPIYLTTNYDDYMVQALRTKLGPEADIKREVARWTDDLRELTESAFDSGSVATTPYLPSPYAPTLFHLHGHAELPLSMVATEDDYLDFLVNLARDLSTNQPDPSLRSILPNRIRRAVKTTTLLFVGYGLNDLNFRVILRGLVGSMQPSLRQIHIAVQYAGVSGPELLEYLERYYEWTLQVNVLWGTARDFCAQLEQRLQR